MAAGMRRSSSFDVWGECFVDILECIFEALACLYDNFSGTSQHRCDATVVVAQCYALHARI